MISFILWRGLWMPGVSMKTSWAAGRERMPRMRFLVVWGLSEMMEIFSPRRQFMSVDFPTFGRPTMAMKPDLNSFFSGMAVEYPKPDRRASAISGIADRFGLTPTGHTSIIIVLRTGN